MNLEPDFSDFLAALIKHKVDFVIVGAFALAHHGAPRATGSAEEVWSGREEGAIGPHRVHFIGRKVYIKNKRACGRTKDLADLESLGEPPAK